MKPLSNATSDVTTIFWATSILPGRWVKNQTGHITQVALDEQIQFIDKFRYKLYFLWLFGIRRMLHIQSRSTESIW